MPKKLIALWINYRTHYIVKVATMCALGVAVLSLPVVSTIALISSTHHKLPAGKVTAVSKKVPKPKPRTVITKKKDAPKVTAPASKKVAVVSPPVVKAKPAPIPVTQPAPSGGAKKLTPAPKTSTSSGSGSSSSSSTSTAGSGSASGRTSPTPTYATGGFTSINWAGYVATAGNYDGVSGSWVAPSATGNGSTTTADASWIGIGGVFSTDLIQTGTLNSVSASGQTSTFAFYELLPDAALEIPSITVSPGDAMSAAINETSSGVWTINISDISTGQNFTTTVNYTSKNSSAEWIEEDPSFAGGSLVPFDTFSPVAFTDGSVSVGGTPSSLSVAAASPITLVNQAGVPLARPTILTADGAGFSVYRQ